MKFLAVLLGAASVASAFNPLLAKRGDCHGNNCNRAITGTNARPESTIRQADCSSFMKTTVTPDAVTVTVTTSVYDTPHKIKRSNERNEIRAATAVPSVVPAYVTGLCANAAEYSTACSCWGITAVKTTAPTPTVTATKTETLDYCDDDL